MAPIQQLMQEYTRENRCITLEAAISANWVYMHTHHHSCTQNPDAVCISHIYVYLFRIIGSPSHTHSRQQRVTSHARYSNTCYISRLYWIESKDQHLNLWLQNPRERDEWIASLRKTLQPPEDRRLTLMTLPVSFLSPHISGGQRTHWRSGCLRWRGCLTRRSTSARSTWTTRSTLAPPARRWRQPASGASTLASSLFQRRLRRWQPCETISILLDICRWPSWSTKTKVEQEQSGSQLDESRSASPAFNRGVR